MQHHPHHHPDQQQHQQHPLHRLSLSFQDQLGVANCNGALSSFSSPSYQDRVTTVSASDHYTAPQPSLANVNDEQLKSRRLSSTVTTNHLLHQNQQHCQCQCGQVHQSYHQYTLQPQQQTLLYQQQQEQQNCQQHHHEQRSHTMLASSITAATSDHSTSRHQPELFTSSKHDNQLLGFYNNRPVYMYANESVHSYCLANPEAASSSKTQTLQTPTQHPHSAMSPTINYLEVNSYFPSLTPDTTNSHLSVDIQTSMANTHLHHHSHQQQQQQQLQPILNLCQHATLQNNVTLPVMQSASPDSATLPTYPQMSVAWTNDGTMAEAYMLRYPQMDMEMTAAANDRSRDNFVVSLQQDVLYSVT